MLKKIFSILAILTLSQILNAADKIKMNFVNEDLPVIIEHYSKESGTRFIIDSNVRGKITLLNSEKVTLEEAYNQLSEALAINGFAILKKDDYSVVRNARSVQRDGIETSTELPSLRPQRMATWIVNLKYISAADLRKNLGRLFTSSYGEVEANPDRNQIIVTDFTSSLSRIAKMIQEIDKPAEVKPLRPGPRVPKKVETPKPEEAVTLEAKAADSKKTESEPEK